MAGGSGRVDGEPGLRQSGVRQSGVCQPGVRQPGVCQPGICQSGVCQPGAAGQHPVASTDAVPRTSSAVPAEEGHTTDAVWAPLHEPARPGARVFVLDTGLADPNYLSPALGALLDAPHPIRPLRPSDATDRPQGERHYLAPAAGHGTFIAGLISQVAPGCRVSVGKVLDNSGVGDEWTIARRIHALTNAWPPITTRRGIRSSACRLAPRSSSTRICWPTS